MDLARSSYKPIPQFPTDELGPRPPLSESSPSLSFCEKEDRSQTRATRWLSGHPLLYHILALVVYSIIFAATILSLHRARSPHGFPALIYCKFEHLLPFDGCRIPSRREGMQQSRISICLVSVRKSIAGVVQDPRVTNWNASRRLTNLAPAREALLYEARVFEMKRDPKNMGPYFGPPSRELDLAWHTMLQSMSHLHPPSSPMRMIRCHSLHLPVPLRLWHGVHTTLLTVVPRIVRLGGGSRHDLLP